MLRQKIGFSVRNQYEIPLCDVIKLLHKTGFNAISPKWTSENELDEICATAKVLNMEIQSLHAPFTDTDKLWSNDTDISDFAKNEILSALNGCKKNNIPILVMHTWIGFDYKFDSKNLCFDTFDAIVGEACKKRIKIAFENTEGEEFLSLLMEHYKDNDTVGFCWDSGHEMCYNHSEDLLKKYGSKLMMTHLNDNLGISDCGGKIFWTDDLHLLPFDGIADWEYNIKRLKKSKRMEILNFEFNIKSKPNRHENDIYSQMPLEQYFTECYKRACRISAEYVSEDLKTNRIWGTA